MERNKTPDWVSRLTIILLGAVALSFLLSYFVDSPILPPPTQILLAFRKLWRKKIYLHLGMSLWRVFAGLLLGVALGSLLGILMGRSSKWNQWLDPIVYLIYPIPKMALLPVALLFLGIGEASKIALLMIIVLPQVTVSVRDGILQTPQELYQVYKGLNASRWHTFWNITFKAILPSIFSMIRISLGTSFSVLFFMENYGTRLGMGFYIMDAWMRMDYASMYAAILLVSGVGLLLFILTDWISRLVTPWQ